MDVTERFTGRAAAYARARPAYPAGVLQLLSVGPESVVADVGSGTGIFTKLLLGSGATVNAVEPNADMRSTAERALGQEPGFRSIEGTAEATTLPDASCDLVTAAQSFHWFDKARVLTEWRRILREGGRAALVWNDRNLDADQFHKGFEALLQRFDAYRALQGKSDTPADFDALFGAGLWTKQRIHNEQELDEEGLVSRVESTSYGGNADAAFDHDLRELFRRSSSNGKVSIRYQTVIISGHLR